MDFRHHVVPSVIALVLLGITEPSSGQERPERPDIWDDADTNSALRITSSASSSSRANTRELPRRFTGLVDWTRLGRNRGTRSGWRGSLPTEDCCATIWRNAKGLPVAS